MNSRNDTDDIVVVVEDSPEWDDALRELMGYRQKNSEWVFKNKPNPKLLSLLLITGRQPPEHILLTIGRMFSPERMWAGGKLSVEIPQTRNAEKIRNDLMRSMKVRTRYRELKAGGRYKAILPILEKEFKTKKFGSDSIAKAIRMTDQDFVLFFEQRLVAQKKKI